MKAAIRGQPTNTLTAVKYNNMLLHAISASTTNQQLHCCCTPLQCCCNHQPLLFPLLSLSAISASAVTNKFTHCCQTQQHAATCHIRLCNQSTTPLLLHATTAAIIVKTITGCCHHKQLLFPNYCYHLCLHLQNHMLPHSTSKCKHTNAPCLHASTFHLLGC